MPEAPQRARGALLTPQEVADHLAIDTDRLSKMRIDGSGPAFIKSGRIVRYHPADVTAWIDRNRRQSTRAGGA